MKFTSTLLATLFAFVLVGCVPQNTKPALTPLELQSLQTRSYEETETEIVFRSVVSVFQDLGFTITNADLATGLISAEGAADSDEMFAFWTGVSKVTQTKATAFVEGINGTAKVRLNFVTTDTRSGGWGQTNRQDEAILDANIYRNAFEKIENAIFVRQSN